MYTVEPRCTRLEPHSIQLRVTPTVAHRRPNHFGSIPHPDPIGLAFPLPAPIPPRSRLPRALSFNDEIKEELDGDEGLASVEFEPGLLSPLSDLDPKEELFGVLSVGCLWEVLKRLPPSARLLAARICKRFDPHA